MAIYKQDMIQVNGQRHGEELTGDEIRFPYRMAGSITSGGVTYRFSRMDNGEAVYTKSEAPPDVTRPTAPTVPTTSNRPEQISAADLPEGAILDSDFVGGRKFHNGRVYRLAQPVKKIGDAYVYVEVQG